ncbi:GNAT family N-acetyltransferase [Kitasatospora sp. NBC_01287]|uniref:GNAT family N-acetyltransferase n=1 Tax=Kitasatospora sp. NBC_01287 TaxID=2903573 RepID=UPI00225860CC|nr:GNAT family N-acetyltransferase [Kitasatospora sp. NBC_01287]MCX4744078.1 GNAT family N-acetyltransferase [Kitasatospora sp. NBC_01287]
MYETERLTLRQWQAADRDRALDLYSRWEVARWLGAEPKPLADAAAAEALIGRFRERSATPPFGCWAVERQDTGVVAGTVLLVPIPDGDGEVEVGWHFHPDSWGKGFATEAARALVAAGFASGLDEIHAVVRPGNDPSTALCRRLGMAERGLTNRYYGTAMEQFTLSRPAG